MELLDAVQANLQTPAVLFFVLGVIAALTRSDLKFPEALYVTLTIYLLTAIGFKGGVALAEAGWRAVWLPGLAAMALGAAIPLWSYPVLRFAGRLPAVDAAAIAAHYGSVSAVTFIAATNFLKETGQPSESYAAAFLAVMESPAIIVGILLGKRAAARAQAEAQAQAHSPSGAATGAVAIAAPGTDLRRALHEAIFGRSVLLLVGGLIIGALCGKRGLAMTEGFFVTPFQGILALFLLEMGMVAARRLEDLRRVGLFLLAFGIGAPLVHGLIGVALGHATGLSTGGAMLLGTLSASASYIAAPAAMRLSLPEANPTLYLTSALAITFPFNITIGIPIYFAVARWWNG
jgi:hypothetical protein